MIGDPRLPARFWSKVVEDDEECWNWIGARTSSGYGAWGVNGVSKSTHRVSYLTLVGPIPDGLQIDHLCKNRICCNPTHLEPVTGRVNIRRAKGLPDEPPTRPIYTPRTEEDLVEKYSLGQLSLREALDQIFARFAS
jgi:hypothetical protein